MSPYYPRKTKDNSTTKPTPNTSPRNHPNINYNIPNHTHLLLISPHMSHPNNPIPLLTSSRHNIWLARHAKSSKWTGLGLAFPRDYNTTLEALHWARMAAKEDPDTVTILIANHKDWTSQKLPLTTKPDVHIMTTIPPHTIKYKPTPEWPTYYQYDEPALTSIICVHNQATLSPNVRTPHTLKPILQ